MTLEAITIDASLVAEVVDDAVVVVVVVPVLVDVVVLVVSAAVNASVARKSVRMGKSRDSCLNSTKFLTIESCCQTSRSFS